ncbi:hypothetical protein AQUCO_00700618v1 [Aquilegia coerulea]|uniref:KIB1-4 beta-propeller domain-containing protein n=1 Tax=Aquilegia coerulea TaxID=218851 RepID=A0A2G5EKZ3_AQUCA|nr:hypothetical protein AQUCO_00700618v1 [Aquilegia coerulea]
MEFLLKLWLGIVMLTNPFTIALESWFLLSKPSDDDYDIEPSIPDNLVVDWLQLPDHILSAIAIKLNHIKDFIRFGAVCQSWRSVYTDNRLHLSHKPSLLMLPTQLNNNYENQTRSFYSLAEARVLDFQVALPHDRICVGSNHGWLVTLSKDWEMNLLNPFLSVNNQIQLPLATTFDDTLDAGSAASLPDFFRSVVKVVLSSNPASNPNYVAMAIFSDLSRLAFFKPGDKAYTSLDRKYDIVEDVIYYQEQFYFVNFYGKVYSCDLNHPQPMISEVAPPIHSKAIRRYIVELAGELLQVCRITNYEGGDDPFDYYTKPRDKWFYFNAGFDVFKLDVVAHRWIKMDNLNGGVLFLGDNSSYSLLASDFTECKPDSIYFTDDYYEGYLGKEKIGIGPHDMGVFNLKDQTLEPHYPTKSKMIIPAPIWIEPTT